MRPFAHFVIRFSYYYSLLLGIHRFEYDFKTGRVRTTRTLTLYSITVNIALFVALPLLIDRDLRLQLQGKIQQLHHVIYLLMTLVHVGAVVVTLIFNWQQRRQFIAVIRAFQRLRRQYFCRVPERARLRRHFERGIVRKFSYGMIVDLLMYLVMLDAAAHDGLTWRLAASISVLSLLLNIMFAVMNHNYFALAIVNYHFAIVNDELARILSAAHIASRHHYYGGNAGLLVHELQRLAAVHGSLHALARRINRMFGIQGFCILSHLYLHNVSMIYFAYKIMEMRSFNIAACTLGVAAMTVSVVCYYSDGREFTANVLQSLEACNTSAALLRQHLNFRSELDVRLERSIESFALQLARNPLELKPLELFYLDKPMVFALFASTVSNSIIIMQYDYQNS